MPIEFPCPECERKLRVKDELAGKRVKCPGCSASITIPDADAPPPAPKKAAVKPSLPAPAPARRPRDEEDEDEAPRRPARGRAADEDEERPRKKPRPRDDDEDEPRKKGGKNAGSSMPLVLGIGGGVLVLLLVGGGIWWMMSGKTGPGGPVAGKDGVKDAGKGGEPAPPPRVDLREWVRGDTQVLISFRGPDILSAPPVARVMGLFVKVPGGGPDDPNNNRMGFRLTEMERLTAIIRDPFVLEDMVYLIETKAPVDEQGLRARITGAQEMSHEGKKYFKGRVGFATDYAAHLINDRAVLVANEHMVKQSLNKPPPGLRGGVAEALDRVRAGGHVVVGWENNAVSRTILQNQLVWAKQPTYLPILDAKHASASITFSGEDANVECEAIYPDDAKAAGGKAAAESGIRLLAGVVRLNKSQEMPPGSEMEIITNGIDGLVNNAKVTQQGTKVTASTKGALYWKAIAYAFGGPGLVDFADGPPRKDGPFKDGPPKDGGKPTQPAIRLTAEAFAQEWAKDKAAAGAKYKGRTVELSGVVSDMSGDVLGLAVMTFVVPTGCEEIRCHLNDKVSWLRASKGSRVTVRGTAFDDSRSALDPCVFVEVGPNPAISITSEALAAEVAKGAEAALNKYKGKTLNVTGQIIARSKDSNGHFKFELKGGGGVSVIFWIAALLAREAEPLKVGQTVTVVDEFPSSFQNDKEVAFQGFRVLSGAAVPKDGPPKDGPPKDLPPRKDGPPKDGPPKDIPPKILPDEPTGIATERMKAILKAQLDCQKKFGGLANDILDPSGKPLLSWRVTLLQFMGPDEVALFKQFSLRQPWNSPHNLKLMERMPSVYAPPGGAGTKTPYMVFRSANTAFPDFKASLKPADFKDGAGHTILLTESTVPRDWTQPIDLTFTAERNPISFCKPRGRCILLGMADGNVLRIPERVSQKSFLAALTPAAGDAIGPDFAPE